MEPTIRHERRRRRSDRTSPANTGKSGSTQERHGGGHEARARRDTDGDASAGRNQGREPVQEREASESQGQGSGPVWRAEDATTGGRQPVRGVRFELQGREGEYCLPEGPGFGK